MEVITSHTNADFDTFASMVAAKKLYPQAHLVFSGSLEKRLKNAVEAASPFYTFEKIKDIALDKVTRLILVDVRGVGRLGPFDAVAKREGVDIHIYDHHLEGGIAPLGGIAPSGDKDLKPSVSVIKPYGSTATVLTHILKERAIVITPDEATIIMSGIYEDTGSLGFPTTTVKDYEAAGHLLSSGADLNEVSRLLRKEMTPSEVALLDEFLRSEIKYAVGGTEVLIAEGYIESHTGDISLLAHRILDIENADSLFLLADSKDRVHIIGRSRTSQVDAGAIARALGGGGHPQAASATLKGVTLIQARETLLAALRRHVKTGGTAADIMSFPPITMRPETTIADAVELLRRYNINAAPVAQKGALSGIITKQIADKALFHGLGGAPVTTCMTTECETVSDDTPVEEIRVKIIAHGGRLLPVLKERKGVLPPLVAGVITRTDLLKLLQEGLMEAVGKAAKNPRRLARLMQERLSPQTFNMLKEAGEVADGLGINAYAVGGFVRDLLLRENLDALDMDIVIENGSGMVFAEQFAAKKGLAVKTHPRFKTAVIGLPDGFKIDVATARLEYYDRPGALPTVEQSSLKLDLYRRDFIINTLAIALNPARLGELIDFFGAQKDLKEKTIRVLHNLSFVEDPVRMLRAVRFAEKFGFSIGKHTLNLIKNSVKLDVFRQLTGVRLFEELKNILKEDSAHKSLKRLHELGILALIHKDMTWGVEREAFFARAKQTLVWHELLYTKEKPSGWLVSFLVTTDELKGPELQTLSKRLNISGKKTLVAVGVRDDALKALSRLTVTSGHTLKNSEVYALLRPFPLEVNLYLLAKAKKEPAKKALSLFISTLSAAETFLKGRDLKKMGVSEGPAIGEILESVFRKRLDNEVITKEDEERFVEELIKKKPSDKKGAG
ncbi:MAG: CBS domain-containing protein [Deltaproteobacteria bacterium]|nr:CBS domain-containing protein [Deltaproteobacteria bacterium]